MEHTVYLVLAIAGCTMLVLQVALQAFGIMGGDLDVEHDAGGDAGGDAGHADGHGDAGHGNWFVGVLSLKALSAFAGIFGLTGLALEPADMSMGLRLSIAAEAGVVAMILVAFLMHGLARLTASGTLDVRNAVGRKGSVYLRIPPSGQGQGKVTLEIQGRSMQFDAVTDEAEIPTGARVDVVGVAGSETLHVRRSSV